MSTILHDLIGIISAATTNPPWHTKTRKIILLTYGSNYEHPDIDRKSTNLFFQQTSSSMKLPVENKISLYYIATSTLHAFCYCLSIITYRLAQTRVDSTSAARWPLFKHEYLRISGVFFSAYNLIYLNYNKSKFSLF